MNEMNEMNEMRQHRQALEEIKFQLISNNYHNQTVGHSEFGRFSNVVGLAFDFWGKAAVAAAKSQYLNDCLNEAADKALSARQTIQNLAAELNRLDTSRPAGAAQSGITYDDELAAMQDLDATYDSLGVVR